MLELDETTARSYIAGRFGIGVAEVAAASLSGGISNHVVLINAQGRRFVLKQSLPKLRVNEDWFSDQSRIFREASSLRQLGPLLPAGCVPEILFDDPEHFAYAMSAAPVSAETWKTMLMNGIIEPPIAEQIARIQADMMRATWQSRHWESEFGNLTAFEQLRLNPYYEVTASRHPEYAPQFARAIERCRTQRRCLVHGDWSPKNMMVDGETVMAIDFEVIHYGDPAFDSAFLLNHLLLKSFHRPQSAPAYAQAAGSYWNALAASSPQDEDSLMAGTLEQLPLLLLARIDGKSPVEYIQDAAIKQQVRSFARALLGRPPASIADVFERLARM